MRSSSSPGSRWVRRFPRSILRGSTIPGNNFDGLVGGSGTVNGVNQFTYTAQFGNGVSGTLSAQDPVAYTQSGVLNLTGATRGRLCWAARMVSTTSRGTRAPDIIGVFKVDQAWGVFQLSAVAHNNHAAYYGGTETTGHPDDKWGWAVQGGLQIKNIPTGAGDILNLQAVYTDGATRYNLQSLAAVSFSMFGGTNLAGAYQSVGFANAPDAVYTGTSAATAPGLKT